MPRYHFDLVDHTIVEDRDGQVLPNDIIATNVGNELARKLYEAEIRLREMGFIFW
jgi:hypothetical protein